MASALMAIVLVPTMVAVRDGMQLSRDIETLTAVNTLCVSKLEEQLAHTAVDFTAQTATGNFAAEGYADLLYQTIASDNVVDGGVADRLMVVTATVWHDADGNGLLGSDEPSATMASKVAKLSIYQEQADVSP